MNQKEFFKWARTAQADSAVWKRYYKTDKGAEFRFCFDEKKKSVWIYCEPTNELKDWLVSFYKIPIKTEQGTFHKGYYQECCKFLGILLKELGGSNYFTPQQLADITFYITGYSYGAGCVKILACLLGDIIEQNGSGLVQAIALSGAKSIGKDADKRLAQNIRASLISVQNGNDTVTKVPLNLVSGGDVVQIGKKRRWHKSGIQLRFDNKQKGLYKFFTVPEHEYENFYKAFDEYLKKRFGI